MKYFLFMIIIFNSFSFANRVELFNAGFEGDNALDLWTIIDNNNDGQQWEIANNSVHSGLYSVAIKFNSGNNNDWLITKQIALGEE